LPASKEGKISIQGYPLSTHVLRESDWAPFAMSVRRPWRPDRPRA
jgi:hypothetical protein